ncbi:MAG: HD domain-containing protein [Treponema sp.]|nr:HD domain-containing protein [Treponema sp.]
MEQTFSSVRMDENNAKWQQSVTRENSLYKRNNGIRSEFERDYTRLLHSQGFSRLKHKTQVFFAPHNDHTCTRMEHVLHVASVSSTIAKYMGLNSELTQAIAIGHDIGHAPFGHTGEDILNSLMQPKEKSETKSVKKFWHERNSLFFADYIETLSDPNGVHKNLDLTYAVRDGLICHCGEIDQQGIKPRDNAMDLYDIKKPGAVQPFTWEGCVVKVSDKIAFIGRDIEDARAYHILDMGSYRELRQLVAETLGFTPRIRSGRAINTTVLMNDMIVDLCEHSSPENGICFSESYFNFIKELKKFCFSNIYNHWRLVEFQQYAESVLGCIYRTLIKTQPYAKSGRIASCLRYYPQLSATFEDWLTRYTNYAPRNERDKKKLMRYETKEVFNVDDWESYQKCIIEYISGMTDSFAIHAFEEIISF